MKDQSSIRQYRALSKKQKDFIREPVIDDEMSGSEWVSFLEPLANYDAKSDDARALLRRTVTKLILLSFFAVGASSFFINDAIFLYAIPVYLVLFFILIPVLGGKVQRTDIDNRLRDFILPMVSLLDLETGHKGVIRMKINLKDLMASKPDHTETLTTPFPGKLETYVGEWLNISTKFRDKSKCEMAFTDTAIRKNVKKRSASGKTKSKTKFKTKLRALVSLSVNKSTYNIDMDALQHTKNGNITVKEKDNSVLLRSALKTTCDDKTSDPSVQAVIQTIATMYQAANYREVQDA